MWNVCRPAALKHLQRVRLAVREPLLHAHAAAFQSRSFADKPSLAGVDMAHVLTASRAELKKELGRPKISQVKRALSKQFTETMSKATITSEDLMELFLAADKVNLDTLLLSSFTQLKERFPEAIDFIVYGAVFRVLSFNHDGQQLWETYEFARTRYPANAIPELVYRFGVVGKVELGDMDGAQALLDEMEANGLEVSNEIYSRVISGYARANNIARVLDLHAKLDPSRGAWHESAIDRVILSLGVAGKPELAFQFYVNSNMKLNGSTLMTLLSVCRHNNCKQQAADILENRKRFPLQLNCRGYNRILETLEFLDQHDQIESVLEEMTNVGVAFDTRTKAIVARNQHVLKGTYFDLEQARQRVESTDVTESSQQSQPHKKKTNPFGAMPRLKQLLEDEKIAEAVKFADEFVRPFTLEDLPESARDGVEIWSDALYVHPSIAKQCVSAYIKNGDDDKIAGLFKGFALTHSNVGYALQEIMVQYSNGLGDKRSTVTDAKAKIAYDAAKLLQSRNGFIHQSGRAFQLFFRFNDVDAVSALCDTLLDELSSVQHADSKARTTASRVSNSIGLVVRFFAESNNLAKAFALFDRASKTGVELQPFHYISLLAGMRTHSAHTTKTKGVVVLAENYREKPFYYVPDDFEKVLDSMAAHNVPVTLGVVGNVAAPLSRGDKRQRLRLIETYEAARAGEEDSYKLPPSVYSVLLQVSGNESTDVNEIKQIYADAVATLDTSKTERNSNRVRIPQDWEVVLISQLADKGHVDEAWAKLENLHVTTGAASYEATVKVLRAAITSQNHSVVRALFEFIEQRKFKPTLNDTYDLVHLAKEAALPSVVCDILDVYEEAHGRDSKDAVGHSKSHQSRRDKFAMRKIRSMYRVALKLCEETGDWKHALSFSTRVNELGLFENEESKSSDKASAGSVSTEPSKDA